MFKLFVLAASAAIASAYTTPTTQCTDGCNPIAKPGLDEVVPAGTAYTITWQPTTAGTVSIVLLKGPSTNVIPVNAIAEKIANTGTFSWTPSTSLQPTGNTGYGLQIIDDADGTFQYSTQFGISNPAFSSASMSASASGSAGPIGTGNNTMSSAAASSSSAPTSYSNSTAVVTSMSSAPTETAAASGTTTLRTITGAVSSASTAPTSTSSNAAVAAGAFGLSGALVAAFAALVAA